MKEPRTRSFADVSALEAENKRLRDEIENLRSRLTSLLRSPVDDSVTRVFRLVSEKNELASQLSERVEDLTSRLRILEDSHATVSAELEKARKLNTIFRQIVDTAPNPVVCADMEGRINYSNPSARALFPEIRAGEIIDIAALTMNGIRMALDKLIIRVLASPEGKVTHFVRTGPRKKIPVHATALQVDGRAIGLVLVFDL